MAGNGNGGAPKDGSRINPKEVKAETRKLESAGVIENLRIDESGGLAFYFEVPAMRQADDRGDYTFDEVQMTSFCLGAFAQRQAYE